MNLNPYVNKWTIKARYPPPPFSSQSDHDARKPLTLVFFRPCAPPRVTAKSDIRRWNNAKGEGTLFSVDLLDEQGSEIRGTFFKELVDKFYTMLDTGRVFLFSGPWATQ